MQKRVLLCVQEAELREREAAVRRAGREVEEAQEGRGRAEAAVLSLVPLNLKVSELRERLARRDAQLSELQVRSGCCVGEALRPAARGLCREQLSSSI